MGWTFYNASGQRLSTAATSINVLDIDGATDIGAAIVDADLFIIDDGAGGTNRKTAASRIVTYIGAELQAATADIKAETNEDTYIPPDQARYLPGMAKMWAEASSNGQTLSNNYNVGSLTDVAVGDRVFVLTNNFLNATYSVAAAGVTAVANVVVASHYAHAVGSVSIMVSDVVSPSAVDQITTVVAFGEQA